MSLAYRIMYRLGITRCGHTEPPGPLAELIDGPHAGPSAAKSGCILTDMGQGHRNPVRIALTAPARWVLDRIKRGRGRPPAAGVREPRRPKPSLPAAAVALDEPRVGLRRRLRLTSRRDSDRA